MTESVGSALRRGEPVIGSPEIPTETPRPLADKP